MSIKQIAVFGLGRFGSAVARSLQGLGHEVLGIDTNSELVDLMSAELTHAMVADSTDEETLRSLGLRNFHVAVVAIGHHVQASILTTVLLKEIGVPMVVAKAASKLHGTVLSKVGADKVVHPERDMGIRLAHSLLTGSETDFFELSPEYTMLELAAPRVMTGKQLRELNLRSRFGINVMAIKTGDAINAAPLATDVIQAGDLLVLLGTNEGVRQLERMLQDQ